MINPRILGIKLIAASILLVTIGSQDAMATGDLDDPEACPPICEPPMDIVSDVDIEEAAEAGNASMTAGENETTDGNMNGVKFLSVQHAKSGSISKINATAYSLELNDVSDKTILFSERPDRIVDSVNTSDFIGNWTIGADSFATDPPNAVLVVHDDEQREDIVVELFDPMYYPDPNALTFDITVENVTSLELPNEFGQSSLVIDPAGVGGGSWTGT